MTSMRAYLLSRWHWAALAMIVAGALSAVGARALVARSLRPVERMRAELDAITSTNLDRRVAVPQTGDELQRVGDTLNATLDRLERAVRANERLVADAAHELRSPLTGVRLALEVEQGREARPLLGDALAEVDRAGHLVDDLLVLAKRPSASARREVIELHELVGQELAALPMRFPDVRVDQELAPVQVEGDREALRRVVRNLLDNAGFYGRGRVCVSTTAAAGTAVLNVDDDGPASPLRTARASSNGSPGSTRLGPGRPAAPASAWPSPPRPSPTTGARSRSTTPRSAAHGCASPSPSARGTRRTGGNRTHEPPRIPVSATGTRDDGRP